MFDDRTNLAQSVASELRGFFGDLMCQTAIPRNIVWQKRPAMASRHWRTILTRAAPRRI